MDLSVRIERWPLASAFTISRGSKTEAVVVAVELARWGASRPRRVRSLRPLWRDAGRRRRGDRSHAAARSCAVSIAPRCKARCRPAPRATRSTARFGISNAKRSGRRAYELAGIAAPKPLITAYTISLAAPAAMAQAAERAADRPLLKVKLGGADDGERIAAVRRAAPKAELIVDANEGWSEDNLVQNLAACAAAGVTLIEQPLPEGRDAALARIKRPIPVCADESVHDRASLAALAGKYDAVNIKLDKTGGLTEALALAAEAERHGFRHHGRLHGGDVACHGAGHAGGATSERRRSRRSAASRQGPAGRPALRG